MNAGGLSMIFFGKELVGTYGLLIQKNLVFSRVLAISQGEFGLMAKMGGWKSWFLFVFIFYFFISPVRALTHNVSPCCLRFCH